MNIEVAEERAHDVLVLLPVERLDSANAMAFESIVMEHINGGEQRLIVDFSRLNFISSSGLRILLIATKALRAREGKIALCALPNYIDEVFRISGFDRIMARFWIRGHRHWTSSPDARPSGILTWDLTGGNRRVDVCPSVPYQWFAT